ncbi:RNA exonuclease 4 [Cryptococcus neoformans c45]|nr:RNA exonuclease 4 [Cryptococcus neoformans var. grubii c45]
MDKKKASGQTVASSNWLQLQSTLPTITKGKDLSNSKAPNLRSSQSPSRRLSSSSRTQRKRKHSQGVGQYMGRVEIASTTKMTVSERLPSPSISQLRKGKVSSNEPCIVLEASSDSPLLHELRHMVLGNHLLSESQREPGQYLAIDCEMVGIGPNGMENTLARVSIVNYHGAVILDTFVQPREPVTDYRTWISGVKQSDLLGAPQFEEVHKQVADLLYDKILIGHAIDNDLKVLMLTHPGPLTRDTQRYKPLQEIAKNKRPGLKKLSELLLGIQIQTGAHSSLVDARVTMALYRLHKKEWERSVWRQTEAYRSTSSVNKLKHVLGKRGHDEKEVEDGEETGGESKSKNRKKRDIGGGPQQFPGGGRKGISSGLDVIVRRNGQRVDGNGRGDGSSRRKAGRGEMSTFAGGENWWEQPAA